MCGIAGIIYRDGGGERMVGRDMTAMLQAMKHRGPDSTGYALYRPAADGYVMHVKLMESSNGHQEFDFAELIGNGVPIHENTVKSKLPVLMYFSKKS